MNKLFALAIAAASVVIFSSCSEVSKAKTSVAGWFGSHKTQLQATADLVASSAADIVKSDVFDNAPSIEDALLKSNNTQGFASAFNTLEAALPNLAITQIPNFVMNLRQIWLPSQSHYTNMAADLGTLIEKNIQAEQTKLGRQLLPAEANQIIEGVIAGLQTAAPSPTPAPSAAP